LDEKNLPPRIRARYSEGEGDGGSGSEPETQAAEGSLKRAAQRAAEQAEKSLIEKALAEAGGNKTMAAINLGISRKTLFNKIKALRIQG
jgi:DNA-binding NtrC family response regulator